MIDEGTANRQLRMYRLGESPLRKYTFLRAASCTVPAKLVSEEGVSRKGMDGMNCVGAVTLELSLGRLRTYT